MATTYCSVEDVADFLRVPITATTTPNKTQVEKSSTGRRMRLIEEWVMLGDQ